MHLIKLHPRTMLLLGFLLSLMSLLRSSSEYNTGRNAYAPGDIMIGGLFPLHLKINRTDDPDQYICSDYDFQLFLHSQVMIYAIAEINQRTPRPLPNLTLGYDIYDTCADVTLAIGATLKLTKNQSDPQSCPVPKSINSSSSEPQINVVIGERDSEVSTAIARFFALTSVSQISYASTSVVLSKKFMFPTFFRTVPSDAIQTAAIYKLVSEFNWKTVAIVGSDDDYGKYGSDGLKSIFKENQICVDFLEVLSGDFTENENYTQKTLMKLMDTFKNSTAEAIIMFTQEIFVQTILKEAIKENLNRTWIASDSWSTISSISGMEGIEKVGEVFGFIYKRNKVPGFKDYVRSMFNGTTNNFINDHLKQFPLCQNQTCSSSMNCTDPTCLASLVDQDESYSVYLAVQVIAEGLRRVLRCDNQSCARTTFTALELFREIQKVNITVNTTTLYFKDGDPSLGYDIIYWNKSGSGQGIQIQPIGEFCPNGTIVLPEYLINKMKSVKMTAFECAKTCDPGHMLDLKTGSQCCYYCEQCGAGSVSPKNGEKCEPCLNVTYSDEQNKVCLNKTDDYLHWADPVAILLCIFAALAIFICIAFGVVIKLNCSTPIVKSVGGYLCFLELCSLLFNFSLIFTFPGKPTKTFCVGIPLFGFGFAVCMSCILANLLQILLGFNFDVRIRAWIKRLNQPLVVVFIFSGIQLGLSLTWLIFVPPIVQTFDNPQSILYQCDLGDQRFLIATVAYNSFLGFICFIFAFKGKQLPDLYKNASLITVSMVLFLIIWIIFLPLFLTLQGKYKSATSSTAILISSYSILCCHLAPKCFIMVFRKEQNNEHVIAEYIRSHYERKGLAVIK